jgi:cell division inhibitor SulA
MVSLAIQLNTEQVIDLVRQLPPDEQAQVLQALVTTLMPDRVAWLQRLHQQGHAQMRQLAAARGQNRDTMDDDTRLSPVDDLIHEERIPAVPIGER